MTETQQGDQQQDQPAKPVWDVSTHGPLPERLKDTYQEVGAPPHTIPATLSSQPQGVSPDGEHAGDRVVEGPTGAGDGQQQQGAAGDAATQTPTAGSAEVQAEPVTGDASGGTAAAADGSDTGPAAKHAEGTS